MKDVNNQKSKIPYDFWNIPRPEISLDEVLKKSKICEKTVES